MALAVQVQTRVKNLVSRRRLTYLPPNGKILERNETVVVPGVLDTQIYLTKDATEIDKFLDDINNGRIEVTKIGFGSGGDGGGGFDTVIGNGVDTVFEINVGFATENAAVYIYNLLTNTPVDIFQVTLSSPNPTSLTLTLTPAPAAGSLQVFVFPA